MGISHQRVNSNCSNRGRNKNFRTENFPIRRVVTSRSVYIATRLHHVILKENFVFHYLRYVTYSILGNLCGRIKVCI
jgi:hypothetical protein